MFTETIAAVFIIGFLAGVAFMQLTAVRNLERQTRRMTSERRRETRQAVYRQQAREHRGTPYIRADKPSGWQPIRLHDSWAISQAEDDRFIAALDDLDNNDRWSRKAPPDNVTSIGATR